MCSWERLDLTCDTRSDGSSSELAQRHSHAAVCVGSAVWIYGGFHGGALSDQLLELWPRDWSWRRRYASGPPATVLHTMVACLDKVILFGGLVQRESASMATNQLWLLDTTQCAWSLPATQGEPPSARVGHAAAVASSQPDGAALMCARHGGPRSLTLTTDPSPSPSPDPDPDPSPPPNQVRVRRLRPWPGRVPQRLRGAPRCRCGTWAHPATPCPCVRGCNPMYFRCSRCTRGRGHSRTSPSTTARRRSAPRPLSPR